MRHGWGIFMTQDGTKYEGQWFEDKFLGSKNKLIAEINKNKVTNA